MEQTGSIWERVAAMPPGPELACLLADLPLEQVPNAHIDTVVAAWVRQHAHCQAQIADGLVQIARSTPCVDIDDTVVARTVRSHEWAGSEIAAALTWTATAAGRELGFAEHLVDHLPLVLTALREGAIDRPKAYIFTQYLPPDGLTAAQIRTLCERFVPLAPGLTTRQLADRLGRAVIAIDPELRKRTYQRSLREAGVACYLDPRTGTATLAASALPPEEAAAACARIDRLAVAARQAGCPGRLGEIAARLVLGLLDGRFQGLTEQQIIDALRDNTDVDLVREGVEVRISLPTLMGRDERPGEIAGLGPVLADVARDAVRRQQRGGSWQFAVIDATGHLLHGGVLRRRPARVGGRSRGGVVQIDVTVDELAELAADAGVWAGVLAEIARAWAERDRPRKPRKRGRFARGEVARTTRLRDQNCVAPGCTRPARRSDLDHTREHARGGETAEANLGPLCTRHHHDRDRGWTVTQPEPGHFVWRSPLGQTYRTRGELLRHDLPDPQPADHDDHEEAVPPLLDLRILWLPPAHRQRPPPARKPIDPDTDEPPF